MSRDTISETKSPAETSPLRRRLTLPLLILYGVGVTIGAGIYVLIGAMAERAGVYAPLGFLAAAIVMGLTAASYAELSARFPVSAAEAAYVRAAFNSRAISRLIGAITAVIGLISSAAVAIGSVGYIREFVDIHAAYLIVVVVLGLGAVAAWGILESVMLAAIFTLIEASGLILVIGAGAWADIDIAGTFSTVFAVPADAGVFSGIASATLLAFFAFVGFEDLANVAEEAQEPQRNLPLAMVWTLAITALLYFAVITIAVAAVPIDQLASSQAPLSLVFRQVTGMGTASISAIAIVATLNTVLVQLTMAARVVYGMARQGDLPRILGRVNSTTATPLVATAFCVIVVLVFALTLPIERLADWTSLLTLLVFAFVNAALIFLRHRSDYRSLPGLRVPIWLPIAGVITCVVLMFAELL